MKIIQIFVKIFIKKSNSESMASGERFESLAPKITLGLSAELGNLNLSTTRLELRPSRIKKSRPIIPPVNYL